MSQILRLVVLNEIPEDAHLRQQWNALVTSLEGPQVFYTYEWAQAVQRSYHATLQPRLFLAYDERDSLCGVAALALSEGSMVSFLCATTGDYCDFLSAAEQKPAFVAAVLSELRKQGLGNITLTNLPADSETVAALRQSSKQNGYRCFARTAYVCAQVAMEKLERRPGETKPVLPRKKMLRRFLSAMGRQAPVRLDHVRSWGAAEAVLPQFMRSHIARFLLTGRISNMARPERRLFLQELAKLLSESGWLTLTRMMSGKAAFAWNYGFQFEGTWFWYQPTFDSDLEKYSPGFCLLAKIIEEAAENPALKTVDLGLGAEEYKDRFTNQSRETLYVTLRTSAGQYLREIVRYRAAQIAKASPALEAGMRAVASRLKRLKKLSAQKGLIGTASQLAKRFRDVLWSRTEVQFFEWADSSVEADTARLVVLDANQLALAAEQYFDDEATLGYLLRSASRLQEGRSEGFVFVDAEGHPLNFAWVTDFDGFFVSELNAKVDAPSPDCVTLFDCWTPQARRGHGYYGQGVALLAKRTQQQGKKPWIFSAGSNISSLRGLEKTGFQRRYSLVRQRALGWQWIKGKTPKLVGTPAAEVSARV